MGGGIAALFLFCISGMRGLFSFYIRIQNSQISPYEISVLVAGLRTVKKMMVEQGECIGIRTFLSAAGLVAIGNLGKDLDELTDLILRSV